MIIKNNYLLSLALLITSATYTAPAFNDDIFNNPDVNLILDTEDFSSITRAVSDSSIVELLISLNAVEILKRDIFLHTNPLNQRNIIDSPLVLPQHTYYCPWVVGGHLFWNQMDRAYFTRHSSAISCYLAINDPDLLDLIQQSEETKELFAGFNIDPLRVLPLFNNMTIQERKLGLMMYAYRQWDCINFNIWAPLYYLERNFFLTEEEQENIERVLGSSSQDDAELFAKNHLISDKFGLGDTRMTLDWPLYDSPKWTMRMGVQGTIPTAFALVKGLMGSHFKRACERPPLDLVSLISLGQGTQEQKEEAFRLGQNFFTSVLNNFAAMVLDTGLGNNGHFGLGGYLTSESPLNTFIKRPWTDNFKLTNRMSLEYLFPAHECRSYIECSDLEGFERLDLNRTAAEIIAQAKADPVYARNVLTFLENQIVDTLVPFAYKTKVCPGIIFRSTTKLLYDMEHWVFYLGTDTWVQSTEKLKDIEFKQVELHRPDAINVPKAVRPLAYQGKLLASVQYKVIRPTKEWSLGLNGDVTALHSGIGSDFTVSLNFDVNF